MLTSSRGVSSVALTVCSDDVRLRDTIGNATSPLKYSILESVEDVLEINNSLVCTMICNHCLKYASYLDDSSLSDSVDV